VDGTHTCVHWYSRAPTGGAASAAADPSPSPTFATSTAPATCTTPAATAATSPHIAATWGDVKAARTTTHALACTCTSISIAITIAITVPITSPSTIIKRGVVAVTVHDFGRGEELGARALRLDAGAPRQLLVALEGGCGQRVGDWVVEAMVPRG
jgi:hypothetical protein